MADFNELVERLTAERNHWKDETMSACDEIERLTAKCDVFKETVTAREATIAERNREIERLTDELVNVEQVAKERYCEMQQRIEELEARHEAEETDDD